MQTFQHAINQIVSIYAVKLQASKVQTTERIYKTRCLESRGHVSYFSTDYRMTCFRVTINKRQSKLLKYPFLRPLIIYFLLLICDALLPRHVYRLL